jgi:hypothetical protein
LDTDVEPLLSLLATLVATVRGEDFLVSVVEGHVKVESPTGAWPAKTYGPLEQGRVRRGSPPERMAPLDPRQADAIREEFRRVDDVVRRKVPRLIGTRLEVARTALEQADLAIGRVSQRITGDAPGGSVLDQDPSAGEVVRAGARVHLTVALAGVRVPDLTRLDRQRAVSRLREAGLALGQVSPLETNAYEAGMIAGQRPGPGTLVPRGYRRPSAGRDRARHLPRAAAARPDRVRRPGDPVPRRIEAGARAAVR